ncbi:hypothetical protein LCGC14_0535710 [marine sediment metagenome]|uniref:Uncharacterized protein n=1 Tax=marine sediment metagenome TaxID=412755 RepID=A0A0F9SCS2_9ZZZZ
MTTGRKVLDEVVGNVECPDCDYSLGMKRWFMGMDYITPWGEDNLCPRCKGTKEVPLTVENLIALWRAGKVVELKTEPPKKQYFSKIPPGGPPFGWTHM